MNQPIDDDLSRALHGLAEHDEDALDPEQVWRRGARRRTAAGTAAAVVAVAALGGSALALQRTPSRVTAADAPVSAVPASPSSGGSSPTDGLLGTRWHLVQVVQEGTDTRAAADVSSATGSLDFPRERPGTLTGAGPVNSFSCGWAPATGVPRRTGVTEVLTLSKCTMTHRQAEGAAGSPRALAEQAVAWLVDGRTPVSLAVSGDALTLTRTIDGDTTVVLVYQRTPAAPGSSSSSSTGTGTAVMASLTGTSWVLDHVISGGTRTDLSTTSGKVSFPSAGRMDGNDGINGFSCGWIASATPPPGSGAAVVSLTECGMTAIGSAAGPTSPVQVAAKVVDAILEHRDALQRREVTIATQGDSLALVQGDARAVYRKAGAITTPVPSAGPTTPGTSGGLASGSPATDSLAGTSWKIVTTVLNPANPKVRVTTDVTSTTGRISFTSGTSAVVNDGRQDLRCAWSQAGAPAGSVIAFGSCQGNPESGEAGNSPSERVRDATQQVLASPKVTVTRHGDALWLESAGARLVLRRA